MTELSDAAVIRPALDALAVQLDGQLTAATTTRRKRAVFYNVLQYAVELGLLDYNPVDKVRVRSVRQKVTAEVDRRVVVNPGQARELLTAVTYVGSRGRHSWRGNDSAPSSAACTTPVCVPVRPWTCARATASCRNPAGVC